MSLPELTTFKDKLQILAFTQSIWRQKINSKDVFFSALQQQQRNSDNSEMEL